VQSEERLRRVEELSRLVSPGFAVRNEVTVCPPDASTAPETLP